MKQLTAKFVAAVTKRGKYHDGDGGLYLYVRERAGNVSKSFVQRLTIHGKRVDIGLGSTKWMPLTDARATAQANRRIARVGGDPRQGAKRVPTFADGVDAVIEIQRGGWRNAGKSEAQWRASLRDYAIPRLGAKPVNAITVADVLAVLVPIWHDKHETARRVRQRIGKVMDWAIAEGHRADNPAGPALSAALPSNGHHRKHHRALPYSDVGSALAAVRASAAYPTTKLAFAFMVLTAARSGEVRGATWDEVDMDAAIWTVPGDRIKSGREHRVPLTTAALDVLREAAQYRDSSGLVFPSARGKVMSDATIGKLLAENDVDAVPHGFRSSFRQWAAERTNIPREVAEFALAHVVGDAAERAYMRSDLFDKRRALMDAWARYVDGERGQVLNIVG